MNYSAGEQNMMLVLKMVLHGTVETLEVRETFNKNKKCGFFQHFLENIRPKKGTNAQK